MIPEKIQQSLLKFLSGVIKKPINSINDILELSAHELLTVIDTVNDDCLYILIQLFKSSQSGTELFHKLMGDHEEENRELVDRFFTRYMNIIFRDTESTQYYNPLLVYLPRETFIDLAFVQSRQNFFLRQTITTINEYFSHIFIDCREFDVGEQEEAWNYFWSKICS